MLIYEGLLGYMGRNRSCLEEIKEELRRGLLQGSSIAIVPAWKVVSDFVSKLRHPNIVQCLGMHVTQTGDKFIVCEYMSKGSLLGTLRAERDTLSFNQLLDM